MGNTIKSILATLAMVFAAGTALAGNLDAPAAPTDPGSAMYTGEDVYNRLTTGTTGAKRTGSFAEPSTGPATGGHTLDDIMAATPAADNTNGAAVTDVLSGKTFWGLRTDGTWGLRTGTVAAGSNVTGGNGLITFSIPDGLYGGKSATAADTNLFSGNIRSGVSIFGVSGNTNVVNTESGDAGADDLKLGKKAWVAGSELSGNRVGGVTLKPGGSFSPLGRWYDNNDGTITDTTTGLVWLKDLSWKTMVVFDCPAAQAPCSSTTVDAFYQLATLKNGVGGLSDGSAAGDWRLPTLKELHTLKTGVEPVSYGAQQLFTGIVNFYYWTTTNANTWSQVYGVSFSGADGTRNKVVIYTSQDTSYLFPVRGGL
jgi:hypothetical protein